jgi:Gram-negative bacterial TonB protein C-terminal
MSRPLVLMCVLVMFVVLAGRTDASAQNTPTIATPNGVVVLKKLSDPVYPPIPRTAHITGDVELMLEVRQDGSIESAVVASGPPLLQKAALISAQQSQFECNGCSTEPTSFRLVFTFQLVDSGCCALEDSKTTDAGPPRTYPQITQSQNRVTVVDQAWCSCDPAGQIGKVRSLKCLYLWRCAIHRW